ncbi:hypothetical protein [Streptomyces hiroshimensis]|uniref:Uncharacterized protein n=1 Tax=Streptomyces hiroshimensis TaxID=66424 RepID=A0ABQ2YAX3_9ACTN|nr:hypothetical protein GCM10010324_24890 [Streptomyces hiroshimensis]
MGLEYGGSGESWKLLEAPCGNGDSGTSTSRATLYGAGWLSSDRKVHLRAGAWGGWRPFGTWGWDDRGTTVTV